MIVNRNFPSGSYTIRGSMFGRRWPAGPWFSKTYFGYTKREAIAQFREDRKAEEATYIVEVRA